MLWILRSGLQREAALTRSMANGAKWVRFVPASGAASRMFAGIREPREAAVEAQLQSEAPHFPFWSVDQKQQVDGFASRPSDLRKQPCGCCTKRQAGARLPKGLIPFHQTEEGGARNSFQEHVAEWRQLMGNAALHFTVPGPFQKEIQSIAGGYKSPKHNDFGPASLHRYGRVGFGKAGTRAPVPWRLVVPSGRTWGVVAEPQQGCWGFYLCAQHRQCRPCIAHGCAQ